MITAMRPQIAAAVILVAALISPALAEPAVPTVTTQAAGANARACLDFGRPLDSNANAHPGDFISIVPAVTPTVTAQGNQLCLDGLAYGTRYGITVHPGLAFDDRTRLANDTLSVTAATPDEDPMVAVSGRGWILPRQGSTGVTIQTVNVPQVRIRVLRMAARMLVTNGSGQAGYNNTIDPTKQTWSLYDLRAAVQGGLTQIWSGTMQAGAGRNRTVETAFPLAGIIDPAKPGAYLIIAEDAAKPTTNFTSDPDDRYSSAEADATIAGHWVLSSDLAVTSLQGQDGLHVTIRSLGSAAPLPGVHVQLIAKSEDTLAEAVTDADGAILFAPGLLRGKLAAAPALLTASTDAGDFITQSLTAPAFDLSDRGAEGRVSPGPIEAFVYTDRGIYRPGDTVNVTALLRTHGLSAVDNAGLTLVLRRPDGVEASRTSLPAAPDAGFEQALPLSATAAQGTWTVEAFVDPSLPPVGRVSVSVMDFVPQQLKVGLTSPAAALGPDAQLTASIDGRFLYGAPAAGLHAEGDVRLVRDEHPVASAPQYSFGNPDETIPDALQTLTLDDADAAGHVAIDAALKIPDGIGSPLRAVLNAGLVEPTGRAVKETLSLPIHNHPLLIGIRKEFGDQVNDGSAAQFAVRSFDAAGAPVAKPGLHWRLLSVNRRWNWWRDPDNGNGWSFHYYTTEDTVAQGTLDVPADKPAELSRTTSWGDYRLVVSDDATGASSSVRFSTGWTSSADADVPDRLEVATDKPVIGVGETAHIHVRGPFAGPAQVIVESAGRVLETRRLDLPADGATLDVTATTDWGAGVHVLAEAFRPLAGPAKAHDPVRAVGLAWVATDPAPHTLAVSVSTPAIVTPRQTIAVPVHVTGAHGRAFVTLAAVDEGILQLTHFATPDPVATLLGRARFAMDLRDDYGRLLEGNADVGALHEGGDEGESLGGAGLPVTTTKVVSLFHGPVELDAGGNASIPLDLPDFAGQLRLMAVAYDHDAAGHAEAALTVRDPVVSELALPRFLAPGDLASVNVSLQDTDGPAGDYHLAVTATGAAGLRGASEITLHLDAGQRREAKLELAGTTVGIGHIVAVLTGPAGLSIPHSWDIAVRSPHPDLVVSQAAIQQPGETYTAGPELLRPFAPGSVQMTIGYSATGAIDVPGLLQSLYTYPFGCTEQLSSAALPLLYYNDARLVGRPAGDPGVHNRVQTAIATIIDRQDAAGEFGLWHVGDGAASVWLNVYTLDFLLRAREAGYTVPDSVTANAIRWIQRNLQSTDEKDGAYAQPSQPTQAYASYVLARTSRVDPSVLRRLAASLSDAPADVSWGNGGGLAGPLSLAQLAGAQSLMGERSAAALTLRLAIANLDAPDVPAWWYNAYFWSRLRDEAGVLAVAAETGQDAAVATLMTRLQDEHLDPNRLNTQEKAWLLMAAHALSKGGVVRTLALDGHDAQTVSLPYAVSPTPEQLAQGTSVRNADAAALFRTVTLRGSPMTAPPAMHNGFVLRRATYRLTGEVLNETKLRQTDRFIVVLSGRVSGDDYRRAMLIDPLPAGIEIEAPVLRADSYPFIGQLTRLRAHEERDDRFLAAFDIGSKDDGSGSDADDDDSDDKQVAALDEDEFRIAYVVRAVTPGRFTQPETVVQDMYHPEVMARTAGGQTSVAPR